MTFAIIYTRRELAEIDENIALLETGRFTMRYPSTAKWLARLRADRTFYEQHLNDLLRCEEIG